MSDFDLHLYLKLVGLEGLVKIGDTPDLDLLKLLVKHQVTHVPYQNYDLQNTKKEVDLSPGAIMKRMLVDLRGGMCFEGCEFMLHVLQRFGFDARRVATFVTLNGKSYAEGAILDHFIIVVHLKEKKYLVDSMFSINSIREPVEFSFDRTEEKVVIPDVEKYLLECDEDHYSLNLWMKGRFAPMYRFHRPLVYLDKEQSLVNYRRFLTSPNLVPIRDTLLKITTLTEDGRIGFVCSYDGKNRKGKPPYSMLFSENNQLLTSRIISYETFRDSIKKIINLTLNDDHFERGCPVDE